MDEEEKYFVSVGEKIPDCKEGSLFGKPCFKIKGKAFVCFFQNSMVFKLTGVAHGEALSLDGSILFDPSARGRPMKEWVQVPYNHRKMWKSFALKSANYVG